MSLYTQILENSKALAGGSKLLTAGRCLSALELCEKSERLAAILSSRGVAEKSGVLLAVSSPTEFIVALLALMQLKAVAIPVALNVQYPLEYWLEQCNPHWLLGQQINANSELCPDLALFLERSGNSDSGPYVKHIPDAAFVRMTSGTTGLPKGVVLSEQSATERIACASQALDLEPGDTVLWLMQMPYHFIVSILLYLVRGVNICVPESVTRKDIIRAVSEHSCSVIYASPYEYALLLEGAESPRPFPSLRRAYCTSGKLSSSLAQQFLVLHGIPLTQIYGVIEVGLPLANHAQADHAPQLAGRATPGFKVCILSPQLELLKPEQVGELGFMGPGLFDGYLKPPALSRELLKNGWYLSGDYARKSESGDVYILGRKSSAFEYEQAAVVPEEIEAVFDSIPGILCSRLIPGTQTSKGLPLLQYQCQAGVNLDSDQLRSFALKQAGKIFGVLQFEAVAEIARTPNGKISRAT